MKVGIEIENKASLYPSLLKERAFEDSDEEEERKRVQRKKEEKVLDYVFEEGCRRIQIFVSKCVSKAIALRDKTSSNPGFGKHEMCMWRSLRDP